MSGGTPESRRLLVDASVFIRLATIRSLDLLYDLDGQVIVTTTVQFEIREEPAHSEVQAAISEGNVRTVNLLSEVDENSKELVAEAANQLGTDTESLITENALGFANITDGDVSLLTAALYFEDSVVVTDDKPLRKTCKAFSIPVSGSIGVLVRAVERDDLEPDVAKDKLYAMDEVGARLSASLIKRAESLIKEASGE